MRTPGGSWRWRSNTRCRSRRRSSWTTTDAPAFPFVLLSQIASSIEQSARSIEGVRGNADDLAAEVRRHDDIALLVDAVSSVAAIPVATDGWDLDFVCTGSQKALALPPGLALGVASPRLLERARRARPRAPARSASAAR